MFKFVRDPTAHELLIPRLDGAGSWTHDLGNDWTHRRAGLSLDPGPECPAWGDYFYLEVLFRLPSGTALYDLIRRRHDMVTTPTPAPFRPRGGSRGWGGGRFQDRERTRATLPGNPGPRASEAPALAT